MTTSTSKPAADKTNTPPDGTPADARNTPLQPRETPDESVLESIGNAISAPVRDAAEDEERKQVGQPRRP